MFTLASDPDADSSSSETFDDKSYLNLATSGFSNEKLQNYLISGMTPKVGKPPRSNRTNEVQDQERNAYFMSD